MLSKARHRIGICILLLCCSMTAHAEAALADLFFILPMVLAIEAFPWVLMAIIPLLLITWVLRYMAQQSGSDDRSHWVTGGMLIFSVLFVCVVYPIKLDHERKQQKEQAERLLEQQRALTRTEEHVGEFEAQARVRETEQRARASFNDAKEKTWRRYSPNGKPWPSGGDIDMPKLATGGTGSIFVYTGSTAPLYVKLCTVSLGPCKGLRHDFVGYSDGAQMNQLPPGIYEVRYIDLATEQAARSRRITIVAGNSERIQLDVPPDRTSADFSPIAISAF